VRRRPEGRAERSPGLRVVAASAGDRRTGEGGRVVRPRDRGWIPRRRVGDRASNLAPTGRVPPLGEGFDRPVDSNEREGGQARGAERPGYGPVRVSEHEEVVGDRAEETAGVIGIGGHDEAHPGIGAAESVEHSYRGLQNPRTLVGVGIEDNRGEVEGGEPLGDGTGIGANRMQHEIVGESICHEAIVAMR